MDPLGVCTSLHDNEVGGNKEEAAAHIKWRCLSTPKPVAKINSVSLQLI